MLIFTNLKEVHQQYMDIFHNEFHSNLSINMEIMGRNSFIPTSKVLVSLCWSHKINLHLFVQYHFPCVNVPNFMAVWQLL